MIPRRRVCRSGGKGATHSSLMWSSFQSLGSMPGGTSSRLSLSAMDHASELVVVKSVGGMKSREAKGNSAMTAVSGIERASGRMLSGGPVKPPYAASARATTTQERQPMCARRVVIDDRSHYCSNPSAPHPSSIRPFLQSPCLARRHPRIHCLSEHVTPHCTAPGRNKLSASRADIDTTSTLPVIPEEKIKRRKSATDIVFPPLLLC